MSISNQTFKELSIPYFKEVFDLVDSVMVEMHCPYYLVGVSAIALKIAQIGIKPPRGTKDIDFAVMLSSMDDYDEIVKKLIGKGFVKTESTWTFYHNIYDVAIDILPFGEIDQAHKIDFNNRQVELHYLGFSEILAKPDYVQIADKTVAIPPFPGMVLLKLISWNDRPEIRKDDLSDIIRVVEHYFALNEDEILSAHYDTFIDATDFDKWLISAEVLGRKAGAYLVESSLLQSRIFEIIDRNLADIKQSPLLISWATENNWEINYAVLLLKALFRGMKYTLDNSGKK